MTSPELVIIITTVTTGIVAITNAISAGWGRKEVRQKAEEVKQVAQNVHQDIVNKVSETIAAVDKVANGDIATLTLKVDSLSERIGHIESWMITERTARTRVEDKH